MFMSMRTHIDLCLYMYNVNVGEEAGNASFAIHRARTGAGKEPPRHSQGKDWGRQGNPTSFTGQGMGQARSPHVVHRAGTRAGKEPTRRSQGRG